VDSRTSGVLGITDDNNSNQFSQDCREKTQGNRDVEGSTSQLNFGSTRNEPASNNDNPGEISGQITSSQFQDFVTTVMLAIKAESTKLNSTIEGLKLEIKRDHE
jgi:hypothetical protein